MHIEHISVFDVWVRTWMMCIVRYKNRLTRALRASTQKYKFKGIGVKLNINFSGFISCVYFVLCKDIGLIWNKMDHMIYKNIRCWYMETTTKYHKLTMQQIQKISYFYTCSNWIPEFVLEYKMIKNILQSSSHFITSLRGFTNKHIKMSKV